MDDTGAAGGTTAVALARECEDVLARVVHRLRHLSDSALAGHARGTGSRGRADVARALAGVLAAAGQGVEQAADAAEPTWRDVPQLPNLAIGDQVAVLGHDLLEAVAGRGGGDVVWAPGGRRQLLHVLEGVRGALDGACRAL